jgi:hypothetical protein
MARVHFYQLLTLALFRVTFWGPFRGPFTRGYVELPPFGPCVGKGGSGGER